jgi:hypothetical protein
MTNTWIDENGFYPLDTNQPLWYDNTELLWEDITKT